MPYFTAGFMRAMANTGRSQPLTAELARFELKALASGQAQVREFDVFLSHSVADATIILGLRRYLMGRRLSVYVDWIDDPQLDRTRVTAATADRLRARMRQCKSLYFATSDTSPHSKWMPWELGYFDGFHPGRVAIVPIVEAENARFDGQEYLGLYPTLEWADAGSLPSTPAVRRRGSTAEFKTLREFVVGSGTYRAA